MSCITKNILIGSTLIVVLLFSSSCGKDEKVPDHLWNEDRFSEVLTEVQLAESVIRLGYQNKKDSSYANDSIYNAAFRMMGTTRVEFDSNYHYYLDHPDKMEKVYEVVITNLSERSAELNQKK